MNLPFRSNLFRTRTASVVQGTCNLPNLSAKSLLSYMEEIFMTNVNHLGRYCLSSERNLYIFILFCINRNLTDLNCRSFNLHVLSAQNWSFPLELIRGYIWNNYSSHSIISAVFKLFLVLFFFERDIQCIFAFIIGVSGYGVNQQLTNDLKNQSQTDRKFNFQP